MEISVGMLKKRSTEYSLLIELTNEYRDIPGPFVNFDEFPKLKAIIVIFMNNISSDLLKMA